MGRGEPGEDTWRLGAGGSAAVIDESPAFREVVVTATISVAASIVLSVWLDLQAVVESAATVHITQGLQMVAAAFFFGSGLLRVSRWRVNGEPRSALMGVALMVFGGLTFPLSSVAGLLHTTDTAITLSPVTRSITTMITLAFVVLALRERGSSDTVRPGVLAAAGIGIAVASFLCLVLAHRLLALTLDPNRAAQLIGALTLAAAWFSAAVMAALRRELPWARRSAALMVGMGTVEVLRAVAVYDLVPWALGSAALAAAIAAITLRSAFYDLNEATNHESDQLESVRRALVRAEQVQSAHDEWREELTHDARNAIAGLRAALLTLHKYDAQLDAATAARLRSAVLGEVGHLEHLFLDTGGGPTVDFEVDSVVQPVVETRRAAGLDVVLHSEKCWAHGRPGDLVTALQNLLVNAENHAPGSAVIVRVEVHPRRIEIQVEDRGPGISPADRERLFARGARGGSSNGSGLGLHVARTLMRQQGGDLELREPSGTGARFVLTVPTRKTVERRNGRPPVPLQRQASERSGVAVPGEAG